MIVDFHGQTGSRIYHWMTQTVIPRPIAWVLSENAERGSFNLAPFSYFTAVSSSPPLLLLSIGNKPDGQRKDTRINLQERDRCVIHIVSADLAGEVTETSRTLEMGESELDRVSVTLTDFPGSETPRIAECPIAFACNVHQINEIGETPQSLILCRINQVYISDEIITQDAKGRAKVDAKKVNPLARLGADQYAALGEIISVPRPA